jgi:Tfp pilus assembly protein FimT
MMPSSMKLARRAPIPRRPGLSLVELLVVIAIIIIVVAIVGVVFAKVLAAVRSWK